MIVIMFYYVCVNKIYVKYIFMGDVYKYKPPGFLYGKKKV